MPFINVKTNMPVSPEKKDTIKTALGKAVTLIPGKSENWLMVGIEPECCLYFKGDDDACAMVDVSVFGKASPSAYSNLTEAICNILNKELAIEASRIYVKYTETDKWGWNGSNF